jgi:predicted ATP-grasp superfamily ATP-dependent carboligase
VLAAGFGLVGLFGVDFVLEGDRPWAVEVNPRYTASVEVLELALGRALLAEHRDACEGRAGLPSGRTWTGGVGNRFVAKEVVFAPGEVTFKPRAAITTVRTVPRSFEVPTTADLPEPGARFLPGAPVLTVFARGPSPSACLRALAEARRRWEERLRPISVGIKDPA